MKSLEVNKAINTSMKTLAQKLLLLWYLYCGKRQLLIYKTMILLLWAQCTEPLATFVCGLGPQCVQILAGNLEINLGPEQDIMHHCILLRWKVGSTELGQRWEGQESCSYLHTTK